MNNEVNNPSRQLTLQPVSLTVRQEQLNSVGDQEWC